MSSGLFVLIHERMSLPHIYLQVCEHACVILWTQDTVDGVGPRAAGAAAALADDWDVFGGEDEAGAEAGAEAEAAETSDAGNLAAISGPVLPSPHAAVAVTIVICVSCGASSATDHTLEF